VSNTASKNALGISLWNMSDIADLTARPKLKRRLKVVAACGNGTVGAFAPRVLEMIGCEVVPLDTEFDHTFRATIRTPKT
jgi:phosphomannomutase